MIDEVEGELPEVTVVCLCYNQALYVSQALDSVHAQHYPNVSLVIVDNASTDGSHRVIEDWLAEHPDFPATYLPQKENLEICRGFNVGWRAGSGRYCIDLAADDILLPERIALGVRELEELGEEYGVHFTDSQSISTEGQPMANFFWGRSLPEGDVYTQVVAATCIPTPSLMFRRSMLEALGGYDESLHYEDFDIMVRAARDWQFKGWPEVLVYKRVVPGSKINQRDQAETPYMLTTARVCERIESLNRTEEEHRALRARVDYELREALRVGHRGAVQILAPLSRRLKPRTWKSAVVERWARLYYHL